MAGDTVLLPVQLEAFTLNPAVCGKGTPDEARICPISQPNYTFLRLDNFLIQNDVQPHADLHSTAPAARNKRMMDLGARPTKPRRNRHGIYLHWILPRVYRSGVAAADSVSLDRRNEERQKKGLDPIKDDKTSDPASNGVSTPEFVQPPTRWMVVRQINKDTIVPASAKSQFKEVQAWVIESDYLWQLDNIPLDYDLQVDVSPFVKGVPGEKVSIEQQAEVFIGRRTPLEQWTDWQTGGTSHAAPPDISILRSSNQLFADFQLHNSNIFSMLDNFAYGDPKNPQYLDSATASYYVIGWHYKPEVDPLWKAGRNFPRSETLSSLFMTLKSDDAPAQPSESISATSDPIVDPIKKWLGLKEQDRLLCHGVMYDVAWDVSKKPNQVPADTFAKRLRDPNLATVSLGTTPIDALITYCESRKGTSPDGVTVQQMEEDILAIEALLHASDDGVEGQRESKDTIYNWAYSRAPGGKHFYISGEENPEGKPAKPSDDSITKLQKLNELQLQFDACQRACKQYAWDIFSWWWKYISDVSNKQDDRKNLDFKNQTKKQSVQLKELRAYIAKLQGDIKKMLPDNDAPASDNKSDPPGTSNVVQGAKMGTLPFYYRGRDPTALIGGIPSGWAADFLDNVSVRLVSQVVGGSPLSQGLTDLLQLAKSKLPGEFSLAIAALLSEFQALEAGGSVQILPPAQSPQFHDHTPDGKRMRDQWGNQQPWFPLYAEWEAEYTHVDFDYWKLDERTARLTDAPVVRYGITTPGDKPLYEVLGDPKTHDVRVLSGRVLVLPQPAFSLSAKVKQLFDNLPKQVLDKYLDEKDRNDLLAGISQLAYLSCPFSGMTEQLATLMQGSHVKPENKVVDATGEKTVAISAAQFEAAGFTKEVIEQISNNSALTPFAASARFGSAAYCPFKPVTHGQLKMTKLNIIDKFGQTLTAIDPEPQVGGAPPLHPCISDWYEPQLIKGTTDEANTVVKGKPPFCEYLQLPPQINQPARLNSHFVVRTGQTGDNQAYWRPATEWENPIWGWVVNNFADCGMQFFLPDGTFYREIRFGGPIGAITQPKWMPFAPGHSAKAQDTKQLDALIAKVGDPAYLTSFWHMITTAMSNLPPAPSSYAQYLNSIVGKPLALVNTGWSLELDSQPLMNQSTNSKKPFPERSLLQGKTKTAPHYTFQVKLGDKEREYDGLVGYFDALSPAVGAASVDPPPSTIEVKAPAAPKNKVTIEEGQEFNLESIRTYFAPRDNSQAHLSLIDGTADYPKFKPFWVAPFFEPDDVALQIPVEKREPIRTPSRYADLRNQKLQVYSAIVDPFTPIHAYSSFLPAQSLLLPSWTWQEAMNTMTAFFHVGPVHLTQDVDVRQGVLTTDNWRDEPARVLPIPSLAGTAGDWSWFQPYPPSDDDDGSGDLPTPVTDADVDAQLTPLFNAYGIDRRGDLLKPGFQKAPYTAIEGFLQLRKPLGSGKANQPTPPPSPPAQSGDAGGTGGAGGDRSGNIVVPVVVSPVNGPSAA